MLLLLALAASVHSDFEGGSIGKVEQVAPAHFRCALKGETDQDGRNRQANWYYFRVDGAAGRDLVIDLVNIPGEYNYRPNRGSVTKDTPAVYSYDGKTWRHFESFEYDASEPRMRLRLMPAKGDRVWIAHVPPYTNADLAGLLDTFAKDPHLKRESAGKTVAGRDIPLLTITNPNVPEQRKKVAWLMFRQHSWEAGSSWAGEGAIRFLLSSDPRAERIRGMYVFRILPMCDPDGVARGGVRFNLHGFDLNRNWDAVDAARMPEIAAQRKAVLDWVDSGHRIDLFLSLHNTETGEYLEAPPAFDQLASRFFRLLKETTTFNPTRGLAIAAETTTPGKPGRMTVNQGLYHDRHIPAFLMEQMIAFNTRLGHLPNVEDRLEFGGALARAVAAALEGPR